MSAIKSLVAILSRMREEKARKQLPETIRIRGHLEHGSKLESFIIDVDFKDKNMKISKGSKDVERYLARAARSAGLIPLFDEHRKKNSDENDKSDLKSTFNQFINKRKHSKGRHAMLAIAFDTNLIFRHYIHLVSDHLVTEHGENTTFVFVLSAISIEEFNWQSESSLEEGTMLDSLMQLCEQKSIIQYPLVGTYHDVKNSDQKKKLKRSLKRLRNQRGRMGTKGRWEIKTALDNHPTLIIKSENLTIFPQLSQHHVSRQSSAKADQLIRLDFEFFNRNTSVDLLVLSADKSFTSGLRALGIDALYLPPPIHFTNIITKNINERYLGLFIMELLVYCPYLEIDPRIPDTMETTPPLDTFVLSSDWPGKTSEEQESGILRGCFASNPMQLLKLKAPF